MFRCNVCGSSYMDENGDCSSCTSKRLRKLTEAVENLFSALDYTVPSWRGETLHQDDGADEVNDAWDELFALVEGSGD